MMLLYDCLFVQQAIIVNMDICYMVVLLLAGLNCLSCYNVVLKLVVLLYGCHVHGCFVICNVALLNWLFWLFCVAVLLYDCLLYGHHIFMFVLLHVCSQQFVLLCHSPVILLSCYMVFNCLSYMTSTNVLQISSECPPVDHQAPVSKHSSALSLP